ncbi:hypothetical protein [Dyadobacter sp. Leaf189]|uniref:hypothetical protein n=1 Tax=Dyadobacter sp. Leaf189 TaxID=1736295 RepID=UPI0006F8785D|nr:hypothetical protein [Dyadobacter sp. Leaf189]KQS33821.1 hypothetical protein ASG33_07170 [Dyadobacter sp. Leaf189]
MAGQTNEQDAAKKGNKKGDEKEMQGWKNVGTAGAGAATGAAAATAIKYSDDIIHFVAGGEEEDDQTGDPEQDPNVPGSDPAHSEGVITSASALPQNQSSPQATPKAGIAGEVDVEADGTGDEIRDSQEGYAQEGGPMDEDEEVIDSVDGFMTDTEFHNAADAVSISEDHDDIIESTYSTESDEVAITEEVSETEMDDENEFIGPPEYDLADDMLHHQTDGTDQSGDEDWDAYNPENII